MKKSLLGFGAVLFALSLSAAAQMRNGSCPREMCDKAKEGKCDMTGQQSGMGRGKGMAAMRNDRQTTCCQKGQCPIAQPNSAAQQKK